MFQGNPTETGVRAWYARPHGLIIAAIAALVGYGLGVGKADPVPPFMEIVTDKGKPASKKEIAEQNVIALDKAMQGLYGNTLNFSKRNFRDQVPIIIALFSEKGGQMILYRPGQPPLVADRVPVAYELAKSVSHSPMAVYQIVVPYLKDPTADLSWRGPMRTFRTQCQNGLDNIEPLDLTKEDKEALGGILKRNIAFMDRCLDKGTFNYTELEEFARGQKPYLEKSTWLAGNTQASHWMKVVGEWKTLLGKDWDKTYAATNTLYVTRVNNILFTILAQYMGKDAINDRLLLIETTEFTTTPEKLIDVMTRIVADRSLGKVFFNDYFLMDVELMSDPSRKSIEAEATKRGMKPMLPTLAPFHTPEWPWRTNPKEGSGPSSLYEIWKVK